MLRDGASRAPRPLYQLGYICDQPYFLIVVWTRRHSPTRLHCAVSTPFAHYCTPLHTPLHTISWACHPYLAFHQPQTPLATPGNPPSAQLGTAPTPDLCGIKSKPSGPHMGHPFCCGLAQPTQPSKDLVWLGHHCQSGISFHCGKPCGRLAYCSSHGPWMGSLQIGRASCRERV